MIIVRIVFHARHGAINQLVEGFKQATKDAPNRPRILTDLSGPFDTMVMEQRHESLAAAEQFRVEMFKSQPYHESEISLDGLIVSGTNEFYTIEQE